MIWPFIIWITSVSIPQTGINCTATDILQLRKEKINQSFFHVLDSVLVKQYPDGDRELEIMIDLTPEMLHQFLHDIDVNSLSASGYVEQEYHFNIAPEGFTDPEDCVDKIALRFEPEQCSFRIQIFNTFLVEPNWCTESMVVYAFQIKNGKVINFGRDEAG